MLSSGWEIRQIYENDHVKGYRLNTEALFGAFGQRVKINGRELDAVLTSSKHQPISMMLSGTEDIPAPAHAISRVLIVRDSDVKTIVQGESLRIDGQVFRVNAVSRPVPGVIRAELGAVTG